jgi:hypothetical protein
MKGALVSVFIFVATYIPNSFFGGYWLVPERDGRDRYSFGLSMTTAIMWQPRWGHESLGRWDYLGAVYWPLIRFDRKFVHPTIYLSDDAGYEKINRLSASQVHPHWRDEFLTKVTATATRDESNKVVRCVFRYTGSDYPREIIEIKMKRELADSLGVISPNGFVEKPYDGRSEFLTTNYVYWFGKLLLAKSRDVILEFPAKQFKSGGGNIVFYYQRADNPADSKNVCRVEIK